MRYLRRYAPRLVAGLGLATGAIACSGQSPPEAGVPMPVGAYARVRVQVTRGLDHADVLVSSRVVGFRGVDRTTADLLTGGDAPVAYGCGPAAPPAPYEDLVALIPDAGAGRIEHLDAGEVTALVDGVALASTATARSPLAPYVGGMEYSDQAAAVPLVRGDVTLTAPGGSRVGAFEVSSAVPPAIDVHATWSSDLDVAWSPADADEVILTIAPEHGASAIVCRAADHGEVHVHADLLARIARVAPGDAVTVVIDRVRRTGFTATGLADASLEVVARDVVTATAQ